MIVGFFVLGYFFLSRTRERDERLRGRGNTTLDSRTTVSFTNTIARRTLEPLEPLEPGVQPPETRL